MLIVFDLDDTLIDTSGSITPMKLRQAILRLEKEGISFPSFEEAYSSLLEINKKTQSSKEAFCIFLEKRKISLRFLEIMMQEMGGGVPLDYKVALMKEANEVLQKLHKKNTLVLVTVGEHSFQHEKMKKAGMDCSVFSKIAVVSEGFKKKVYEQLVKELGFSSKDVLVCADRIELDLVPAKELGYTTVHMKWGRGLVSQKGRECVDYTIEELKELIDIVKGCVNYGHE